MSKGDTPRPHDPKAWDSGYAAIDWSYSRKLGKERQDKLFQACLNEGASEALTEASRATAEYLRRRLHPEVENQNQDTSNNES